MPITARWRARTVSDDKAARSRLGGPLMVPDRRPLLCVVLARAVEERLCDSTVKSQSGYFKVSGTKNLNCE